MRDRRLSIRGQRGPHAATESRTRRVQDAQPMSSAGLPWRVFAGANDGLTGEAALHPKQRKGAET